MKINARNQIPDVVTAIIPGAVNGTVKVDIGGGKTTDVEHHRRGDQRPGSRRRRQGDGDRQGQ